MLARFQDSVVWITGGGSGLGRAMAHVFAREGARVALSGRRVDRLEAVAAECGALGAEAWAVPCDITEEQAVASAVDRVIARHGRLDMAIANAGSAVGGPIRALHAEDWHRQLDVNVVGTAMTAAYALPWLEKTRGRLALTCSVSGLLCSPGMGAFHASKYAVRAMGQTLSLELAGSGVSCTTIHPGFVVKEDEVPGVRPAFLMWRPEEAAPLMVDAIYRREREYVFTRHGRLGAFVGRHAPDLAYHLTVLGQRLGSRRPAGPAAP